MIFFNPDIIINELKPVNGNEQVSFFLSNRFSLHNLFSFLLHDAGPSDIRISTFSLCETAINNFILENERGLITNSKVLLDHSLVKRNIDKLLYINNVLQNIRLCDNHSKIITICGKEKRYAFIGSCNFNNNRKIESGVVFKNDPVIDTIIYSFDQIFDKSISIL